MPTPKAQSVIIIGAGPVGLCCALAMARVGHTVTVVDSGMRGAGWASGGMLGGVYETLGREDVPLALTDLAFESAALWDVLAADAGIPRSRATVFLARHHDDTNHLTELARIAKAKMSQTATPAAMACTAAWACAHDATLDPRDALQKLRAACLVLGVGFVVGEAERVGSGSVTLGDGTSLTADAIIVATGQGGSALADSVPELAHISPVKGQMLAVARGADMALDHTIRAGRVYLIPRGDQIVIGATSNPQDRDPDKLDLRAHHDLHQEAIALWPALASAPVVESWSGFRPMTPDGLPMFGRSRVEGVYLATGTYRNGWLLAPAIGKAMVAMVEPDRDPDSNLQLFSPLRFPI